MASWNSLPYELKLRVAEGVIDLILSQTSTFPIWVDLLVLMPLASTAKGFDRRLRKQYMPEAKLQLHFLLELAPELRGDLLSYCRKRSTLESFFDQQLSVYEEEDLFKGILFGHQAFIRRVYGRAEGLVARLLAEDLEGESSFDLGLLA